MIQKFKNELFNLSVKSDSEENMFSAEDVARALGFITKTVKNGKNYENVRWSRVNEFLPQVAELNSSSFISESMVYKLAFKANNAVAEKFTDWLAVEVLPSIRKHGAYMTSEVIEQTLTSPDFIIGLATRLKSEQQARLELEKENNQLNVELAEATEKTRYLDLILESPDELIVKQIAQDYGTTAVKFNQILNKLRVQYKQNNQWILYSKYQGKGYIKSRTFNYIGSDNKQHTRINTCWTQKGREFLYRKLKKAGYLPVVEQRVA